MKSIEYVASGTSHTRILASAVFETPEVQKVINDYFKDLNGRNNHYFSLLFNAFTEKSFGPRFQEFYRDSLYTVHADSGGLQIVTQGRTITPELKDQVYRTQSKYSDIAMCFDEIPINIMGDRSDRNDVFNRFFDKDNLEHYARETGKNIKRQIDIFLEEKTTAKPMIIAQGNCYETYMAWVEYLLKEIPPSYLQHIGGIAMGAAALGTGTLEDIERAAYATKLPFQMEEPYIHILGVGAIKRLLPYIALAKSGYYPPNLRLSYDSTTHTCGVSMGLYFLDGGLSINRTFDDTYITIYNDVNEKYDLASKGIDLKLFFELLNNNSSYYTDKVNIDKDKMLMYYAVQTGFICSSIANFTYKINNCLKSKQHLIDVADDNKVFLEINSLLNINNLDDFLRWKNVFGNSTKSKRIRDDKPTTLEAFL